MSTDPSTKPGEVSGKTNPEQKAAEQPPEAAKATNPVGEATQRESKDPYAEGKPIANPEPNNGKGVNDSEKDPTEKPAQDGEGKVYDPEDVDDSDSQPSADER